MLPRLKTPFSWRCAVKDGRREGERKNQGRKDKKKDPQTPVVSKVAQQAEHYALGNSKCCWQAGWLLAGEELSASLPQIQTSRTVDICNGTRQYGSPAVPWAARQERPPNPPHIVLTPPSHTINNVHAVFTENATFFIFQSSHSPSFVLHFWDGCFVRGMMLLSVLTLRSGFIWLCNLKKSIFEEKKQRGATISTWDVLVISPCQKCHWWLRLNVIYFSHSSIYLLYLFTYRPLDLFFYLKEKETVL